jgi:hypothetical protein
MAVVIAVETVVLVLLTILVAGLLRSHADILRRLHALDEGGVDAAAPVTLPAPRGAPAVHDVAGTGLDDDVVHVAIAGTRHRTLLAFLSSGCLTCRDFWQAFADPAALDLPGDVRLVVVTKNEHEESIEALRDLAPDGVPVVLSSEAWADYDVPGSPYFVLVDGSRHRVEGEGTGASWPQVRNLVVQARGDADEREARIDRELLAHGIGPGDPLLYHEGTRP